MHDWSDSNCVKLLKNLRMVAKQDTKLVIIDSVISTACENLVNGKITHGENQELPPYPLLPNMGYTSVLSYMVDLVVYSFKQFLTEVNSNLYLGTFSNER